MIDFMALSSVDNTVVWLYGESYEGGSFLNVKILTWEDALDLEYQFYSTPKHREYPNDAQNAKMISS